MRISREHPLLLASGSPRRRELLDLARIAFEVVRSGVDESIGAGEQPLTYAARLARAKLAASIVPLDPARDRDGGRTPKPPQETQPATLRLAVFDRAAVVLAADTIVVLDGRVCGKPESPAHAREMLRALSGRAHEVATAFALGDPRTGRLVSEQTVRTAVEFRALRDAEIDAYVETGEGTDKAGGYAIQGMAGALVRRIEGSHTNVIGLPTAELIMELERLELL